MATPRPASRAAAPFATGIPKLGPLAELPGSWVGTGFNLIARPDFQNNNPFFLEINGTIENLDFTRIGGDIPNRGSQQGDIGLHGVHYLQQVSDCATHGQLHIEPGLWLFVPAKTDPNVPRASVVRHATIPHGDSLLAQSTFFDLDVGQPKIDPVDSFPFTDANIPDLNTPAQQILGPPYTDQYQNRTLSPGCLPQGLDLNATVKDPTTVLRAAIQGQTITKTTVIVISTAAVKGSTGILNIPFIVRNANALQMDAIFWIETVQPTTGDPFMQLQYVQRVILDFPAKPGEANIHWPHISVATLVKQ
jgi:hypothetical protein